MTLQAGLCNITCAPRLGLGDRGGMVGSAPCRRSSGLQAVRQSIQGRFESVDHRAITPRGAADLPDPVETRLQRTNGVLPARRSIARGLAPVSDSAKVARYSKRPRRAEPQSRGGPFDQRLRRTEPPGSRRYSPEIMTCCHRVAAVCSSVTGLFRAWNSWHPPIDCRTRRCDVISTSLEATGTTRRPRNAIPLFARRFCLGNHTHVSLAYVVVTEDRR